MTSKTFKCVEHEEEVLEVYPFTGEEAGRKFSLLMPHVSSNAGIAFDSTTAPALALAILEAAGVEWNVDTPLGRAAVQLDKHVTLEAKAIAEAEAQAKLEAEALELVNAWRAEGGERSLERWDAEEGDMIKSKPFWLAVARRARELNKEENNA